MDAIEFIQDVTELRVTNATLQTPLSGISGWDSFTMVKLSLALEERLNRHLEFHEIESLTNIADVQALLLAKR